MLAEQGRQQRTDFHPAVLAAGTPAGWGRVGWQGVCPGMRLHSPLAGGPPCLLQATARRWRLGPWGGRSECGRHAGADAAPCHHSRLLPQPGEQGAAPSVPGCVQTSRARCLLQACSSDACKCSAWCRPCTLPNLPHGCRCTPACGGRRPSKSSARRPASMHSISSRWGWGLGLMPLLVPARQVGCLAAQGFAPVLSCAAPEVVLGCGGRLRLTKGLKFALPATHPPCRRRAPANSCLLPTRSRRRGGASTPSSRPGLPARRAPASQRPAQALLCMHAAPPLGHSSAMPCSAAAWLCLAAGHHG